MTDDWEILEELHLTRHDLSLAKLYDGDYQLCWAFNGGTVSLTLTPFEMTRLKELIAAHLPKLKSGRK
jgi:hypothetical protein